MNKQTKRKRQKQFMSFCMAVLLVFGIMWPSLDMVPKDVKKMFGMNLLPLSVFAEEPSDGGSGGTDDGGGGGGGTAIATYTIDYIVDGQKLQFSENGGNRTVVEDFTRLTLKTPTKEGAVFDGWYTDEDFAEEHKVTSITVTKNTTLYGRWGAPITYYVDGEPTEVADNPSLYFPGTEVESLAAAPAREGFVFDSWYQDENMTKKVSTPAIASTDTEAKSFYANYFLADSSGSAGGDSAKIKEFKVYVDGTLDLKSELGSALVTDSTTFKSSDEKIAKADDKGIVTGIKAGSVQIGVYQDNHICFSIKVTVTKRYATITPETKTYKRSKLKNKKKTFKIIVEGGGKRTFKITKEKYKKYIKVNKKGKVTVKKKTKAGTYVIKVIVAESEKYYKTVKEVKVIVTKS